MGSIFKAPKIVAPEPLEMPKVEDVPEAEDPEMVAEAEAEQREKDRKRKGRRSTILTGTGLNEIEDQNISKRTLLG